MMLIPIHRNSSSGASLPSRLWDESCRIQAIALETRTKRDTVARERHDRRGGMCSACMRGAY